jgi:hypothetical protein
LPRGTESFGYRHPAYAASLAEFGRPVELTASGGFLLERRIPGSTATDAMGPYPLFACGRWEALPEDLAGLSRKLVSVVLVADPFGTYDDALLARTFDSAWPFKTHYVVDLARAGLAGLRKHHRYYTRRALAAVDVEVVADPVAHLDEWDGLYGALARRHRIAGIRRFSRTSFRGQLDVPGMVMLRAARGDTTVGIHLWFLDLSNGVAYSHLAATSDEGYSLGAAYALHWAAIEHFRGCAWWLDLGAGAGTGGGTDGLTAFKAGWATDTRPAYICGRVFRRPQYSELVRRLDGGAAGSGPGYFPAYRAGEYS